MASTITVTKSFDVGGEVISTVESISVGNLQKIKEESCANGATTTIIVSLDASAAQAIFLKSDQAVTLTSSANQSVALAANAAVEWTNNEPAALKPFTDDFTSIDVNNQSGSAALVTIVLGTDVTP